MKNMEEMEVQDASVPLPANRAPVPYKRLSAYMSRHPSLRSIGAHVRAQLVLLPAIPSLLLAMLCATGSTIIFLNPELVGNVVAGKFLALALLLAVVLQLVIATVRSLLVPVLGFGLALLGIKAAGMGKLPPFVDVGIFQVLLVACSLGVVARCVFRRQ